MSDVVWNARTTVCIVNLGGCVSVTYFKLLSHNRGEYISFNIAARL